MFMLFHRLFVLFRFVTVIRPWHELITWTFVVGFIGMSTSVYLLSWTGKDLSTLPCHCHVYMVKKWSSSSPSNLRPSGKIVTPENLALDGSSRMPSNPFTTPRNECTRNANWQETQNTRLKMPTRWRAAVVVTWRTRMKNVPRATRECCSRSGRKNNRN